MGKIFLSLFAVALATAGRSTGAEDPLVARIEFFNAKPGGKAELEQAIKKQMDWRRQENDEWRWLTWEYVSGEDGRYALATFSHAWEDFDKAKLPPQDSGTLTGIVAKPAVVQFFDHLEEVSTAGTEQETPTMAEIAVFQLQFGKTAKFYEAVRNFHEAMQKAGSGERYEWFELLSGGEGPQFMLFLPRRNWGGLDTKREFLSEALEKSLGKRKMESLIAQFSTSVRSYHRWAVRLRPDLSKLPASGSVK